MQYFIHFESIEKNIKEQRSFQNKKGHQWPYLTIEEYKKLSEEKRRICGDLRKQDSGSAELTLREERALTGLYEYRPKKRWSEKTIGYIPVIPGGDPDGQVCCVRILGRSMLKTILLPFLFLCLVAGIVLGILWYLKEEDVPGLDESQIAYHVEGMVNNDPSQIMLPGISQITAQAGETHVEHVLFNPEGNPCYFKFHLVRDDTAEELYTSGLVEPGNAVMEFDLTEPLEAGSYDVTVQVETHPVDDPEGEMNQGAVKTTLVVE